MRKIITALAILLLLAAAFFASYTLCLRYWSFLSPYLGAETTAEEATT